MLELAFHYDKDIIRLRDIAEEQEISAKYLEHFLASLKSAGLIRSIRGAHGGYTLTSEPSRVRLGEILRVLEGTMAPVECVDDPEICRRHSLCPVRDVWCEMKEALMDLLDSVTLQDLVERQKEREHSKGLMYHI
jgi:Rrf2 family protein